MRNTIPKIGSLASFFMPSPVLSSGKWIGMVLGLLAFFGINGFQFRVPSSSFLNSSLIKLSKAISKIPRIPAGLSLILGLWFFMGSGEVMGQIALRGSNTNTSTNNSLTINRPAGLAVGDIMIANIGQYGTFGGSGGLSHATSPGWTRISGAEIANIETGGGWGGTTTDTWWQTVLYKVATTGDVLAPNFTFYGDVDTDYMVGGIVAFSGVDTSNPFDVTGNINTGYGDDLVADQISPTVPGNALVMLGMVSDDRGYDDWITSTPGPGNLSLTEIYEEDLDSGEGLSVGAAWALNPNTGNTGDGDAELSSNQNDYYGAILLALRPLNRFKAQFSSPSLGSSAWCPGETRSISVVVTNTGSESWTSGGLGVNFSWWWNSQGQDTNPRLYPFSNLAPGASQTLTLNVTAPSTPGTYTLNFDVVKEGDCWFRNNTGSCGPGNISYSNSGITVSSSTPANLSYTNNGPLVYCANQAITPNNASTSGGSTPTSYSVSPALPAGLTLNTTTGRISGTPTTAAGVPAANYTVTASNSCGSTTRVLNITISPAPTVNAGGALAAICQGGTSAALGGSVGGSATGGTWSSNVAGGTFTPNATTLNATWTPPTGYNGTATLTLTTSGGSCGTVSANKTITVNPAPSATPATSTVCVDISNGNIITQTTIGVTSIGTPTGLPPGVVANFSGNTITISGTPTGVNTYNYTIPLFGTCATAANATGTITVENCVCEDAPITTPGTGQITIPTGVTSITVEVWGGGGRGGSKTDNDGRGGGGGGGAYSRSIIPVTPGTPYYYNVGQGSPASTAATPPAGGDSWFSNNLDGSSPSALAKGGSSVNNRTSSGNTNGANGGLASAGIGNDEKLSGGNGANGSNSVGGGGGSSAGSVSNGVNATGINGAIAPSEGGNGGNGRDGDNDGFNGNAPGGGGGGAERDSGSRNGGAGGNGQIKITYTLSAGTLTGYPYVCVGQTTEYESNLPGGGGTWSSSNTNIATVDQNGFVTGEGAGTAIIFYTVYGSCSTTAQASRTVFVTAPLPAGTLGGNQDICIGGTSTFTSNTSNGTWSSSNPAIATVHPTTGLVTGIATGTATISYTLPQSGICLPVPGTRTVTVTPPPSAGTLGGIQQVCVTGTTTFTTTSTGGTWSSANPAIATINPATGLVTGLTSGTTTMTYTVAGTGGCSDATASRTITITAVPTAGTLSGVQEVCIGGETLFTSTASGGTWSSSNNAVATISSSGEITGLTAGTATMTYTVTGTGGCASVFETRDVTVHALPTPTFTLQANPQVCLDEQVTYTTQSGMDNYDWSIPGDEGDEYIIISGGAETDHSVTLIWKSAGSKSVGINYTNVNGCTAVNPVFSADSNVEPDISIDSESLAAQTICDGGAFSPIYVVPSGPGTFHYQWYKNTSASTTGGTPVGTDSDSYLPLQSDFSAIGDGSPLYYYAVVSQTSGGCGDPVTSSISGAFIVKELVQITSHPDTTGGVECFGDGFPSISVTATGSDLTYQWYSNTTQSNSGGTLIPGETDLEFTPPSTATLNIPYYYYVVVSGYCAPAVPSTPSGAYTVTPPNTTITVDLNPNATDEVRCIGDDSFPELTVEATGEIGGLPAVNYQWYRNDSPENTGGTAISGETDASFTPQADEAGTWYYYASASSDCGTVPSAISGAFIVNPNTQIDDQELDGQIICEGDDFDPISVVANSGFPDYQASLSYQWYSNTDPAYTGPGLDEIDGATDASYTPLSNVTGSTLYYFVVVSSTHDCGPDVTSAISGAFRVNPTPTLSSSLTPTAICSNTAFTYTPTGTVAGSTFTWTRGAVAGISNPAVTAPQTSNPNETLVNTTVNPIDVVYTYTISANNCTNTQNVTVTVNPTPVLSSSLTPTAICSNTAFTYAPTSATVGATFTWTREAVIGISNPAVTTPQATNPNETLVNTTANPVNVVYTYTTTANGCSNTQNVTVTVNPRASITPTPITRTICSGAAFTVTPVNGTNGIVPTGTTYTWVVAPNGNVTGETGQATPQTSISQTLTNTGTVVRDVTYTVTPTSGACQGTPFTVVVTVNPTPTVNDPSDQEICANSNSTAVNFTGNAVAGVVYNWTNNNTSIGLAASGTGNIPAFTATNTTENDLTATITVTPSANGCDGPAQTFTITVNPSPIKSLLADYCAPGGEVGLIASANKPGTTWLWSTGETTSSISVKIAGTYSVTATSPDGCVETRSIPIAQELVINGDFTDGNTVDPTGITGFNTGYAYTADVAGDSELVPEGRYGIGPDAHTYHNNFWGSDHTNNTVGPRNMMIVNGYPGSNSTIIWEQEVTVRSGVDYYFSAYAMSLNNVSPYAKLRFEVNGEQVGTTANLGAGVENNSNDGWEEFYGIWPSTVAGTIKIRIVNLEPAAGGNDFALDDLSFGTLSTFITLTSAPETDDQVVCQDFPIDPITYSVGSGVAGPVVTNLPPGVTTTWNGVTLLFSGTPTTAGDYTYTITTTGVCSPTTATGRIIVRATPTAGEIAAPQTVCTGEDPVAFTSTTAGTSSDAGATISYRWESNTNLTTPDWDPVSGDPAGSTYDPPVLSATTQFRRITLATNGTLVCESEPTAPITVTVQSVPTAGAIAGAMTVCGGGNPVEFTSTTAGTGDGTISYRWESAVSPFSSWSTISGATAATYDAPSGLTATTRYRRFTVSTLNGTACESAATAEVQVTVQSTPSAGVIAADQTICQGGDPAAFTSTTAGTGDGIISYRWESAVSPFGPTDWSTISGATSATYDVPSGLATTTQYRRITVSTLNGSICESAPTASLQVTVNPTPTAGGVAASQTICIGDDPDAFTSTTDGTGTGTITYLWESNTNLSTPSWSTVTGETAAVYDVPSGLTTTTQYRRTTIATSGSLVCLSVPTAPLEITVQSTPIAGAISADQSVCSGGDPVAFTSTTDGQGDGTVSYIWESATDPSGTWTEIPGAIAVGYDAPSGLTVATYYRRTTVSDLNGRLCYSSPTTPVQVTFTPDNEVVDVDPDPTLCLNEASPIIITHTTTGITGIEPQSASVNYNLPNGVTPVWNAGVLTVQGTPTEMGVFDYNIPLTGGCGPSAATGTITVENPTYPITAIHVVNPPSGASPSYSSTFTVYSNELTAGDYTINYSIDGVNGGADQTIIVTVTTPGQFTFNSLPYTSEGTTLLTINWIKKNTEDCTYYPPNNNTAVYGFGCSNEFLQSGSGDAFYVPVGVYQVRIEAYGGSPTTPATIAVIPGGVINIGVSSNVIFATTAPLASATSADWLVSATGPNGRIVFHYDCNPQPDPECADLAPYEYIDSEGFTVLRFDVGACNWYAPDGLDEFEVLIVGGGGGGGFGNAAGGGGGGAVVYQHYTGITMNGQPGLQGAVFPLSVGNNGQGAIAVATRGGNGQGTAFTGPAFASVQGPFTDIAAEGGGGGGSTSSNPQVRQGGNGASGGGGAAFGMGQSNGGVGQGGGGGGVGNVHASGASGAGGGGAAGPGLNGIYAGGAMAGAGGAGEGRNISGNPVYYGAGGGGTSSGAVTNQAGAGGSPYTAGAQQYFAGGSGTNNGVGQSATTHGSGGGAGRDGGGAGFPGVVYIRYPNYRILPIEYLYFNAKYNPTFRSGDLTWATAKEWENDRFEIERSVNNVTDWEAIGQVKGAGYSDQPVSYSYQDLNLPLVGGTIFYRLKQFDFDGDSTYSDTKAIQVEPKAGTTYWRVYPNPTTGDPVNLEMLDTGAYDNEEITVRVISATGVFDVIEGTSSRELSLQLSQVLRTKAAGIYTVEISWGENREYHKVILRR